MNYTRSDKEEHEDSPRDWLNSALIMTRALGLMLQKDEGIVVDILGDMQFGVNDDGDVITKVIVFDRDDQIVVMECEEDIPEGTLTWHHEEEEEEE
jgi:hypothetical protein